MKGLGCVESYRSLPRARLQEPRCACGSCSSGRSRRPRRRPRPPTLGLMKRPAQAALSRASSFWTEPGLNNVPPLAAELFPTLQTVPPRSFCRLLGRPGRGLADPGYRQASRNAPFPAPSPKCHVGASGGLETECLRGCLPRKHNL